MHICLFDIDGTLISSGGAGKAALEAALASEFGVEGLDDTYSLSGRTDRSIVTDLVAMYKLDPVSSTAQRLSDAYLRHLPEYLRTKTSRILPGITTLLDHLRQRDDVALGLLTGNIRKGAHIKLTHFGLWDYFPFGGFGDDHLDRDDVAREALCKAHECLNGKSIHGQVWVIGDTPLDIRCARAIGAQVVAVATGWHTTTELAVYAPDILLEDLADASPLLNRLQ